MEHVLQPHQTPHRWQVILSSHIDDVDDLESAREDLYENLRDVWINFVQASDDNEVSLTITLNWLDQGMTQMVRDIVESKHDYVKIIFNGGVNDNGDRIKT